MSAEPPILRAEDVRAGYGAGDIIHGISVSVAPGTVASVVGPNGSGKSTLLKALAGVIRPSSGRVLAGDRDLNGLPPEEVARAGIGYVPQTDDIFAPLTVRENLEMGGYLLDKREVSARVKHVTAVFPRLGQMLTRRAGRLSGGERKMLAMGRVLMIEPAVFLLDEPTANLAPQVAAELLTGHVRALAEAGAAVLIVEQRARAVLAISDYTYVLGGGQVLMDGTPALLAASQEFTESFFGTAPQAPKLSGAPGEHGGHKLAAAAHAELVERRGKVLLDRVGGDVQLPHDLPGGVPPDDQRDHPGLRTGEPVRAEQQRADLRRGGGLDDDADLRRGLAAQPGCVQGEPLPGAAAQPDRVRQVRRSRTLLQPGQPRGRGVDGHRQLAAARPVGLVDLGQPLRRLRAHRHQGQVLTEQDDSGCAGRRCTLGGRTERAQGDGSPQALGHVRGDPPDHVDLPVIKAVLGVLAVQADRAPALLAADEDRAQLIAQAERAHHLPVSGTVRPLAAGGPVERTDRIGRLRQCGELVDVPAAVLVVQEERRRSPQRFLGHGRGEQQGLRVDGAEERRVHRHDPAQPAQHLVAQFGHVEPGVTSANERGYLAFHDRVRHKPTILKRPGQGQGVARPVLAL